MQARMKSELSAPMREWIETCQDCHNMCLETMNYCLQKGGEHADRIPISLMMDCAQICETSVDLMTRNSSLHGLVCAVCADVREQCAESWAKFKGDATKQEYADAVRTCSGSCGTTAATT